MPKINKLYAFIAEDNGPDDEGIMGFQFGDEWMPMIGADMERVNALIPIADQISEATGKPYKIKYFTLEDDKRGAKIERMDKLDMNYGELEIFESAGREAVEHYRKSGGF